MVALEPDFGNAGWIIDPFEVSNQAFLDAEYRVAVDIGVVGVEDMSRDQLQDKVLEILGRLSVLGVEFKRCEHFDNAKLYDWLIHKVIPWERVHPELQQFQMTRFFDTSLWCDDCGIYQSL